MRIGFAKGMTALALCGTLIWTSCSTVWVTEAEQIVAALIPALENLVTLAATLQGRDISPDDLRTIQSAGAQAGTDLQLMESLMAQYEKADTALQPGLLNQIQVAMSAVQTILNGLLPALHIKDAATQAKITAVIGILLSETQSVAAMVPLMHSGSSSAIKSMAAKQIRRQPPLTAGNFVSSYNAAMMAKTGNAALDQATPGMQIHLHGKLARWASAGFLK